MSIDRKLRTCFITVILLISTLSVLAIIPGTVSAEGTKETTLYFHPTNLADAEDLFMMAGSMDTVEPTSDEDLYWPPRGASSEESTYAEEATTWIITFLTSNMDKLFGGEEFEGLDEMIDLFTSMTNGPLRFVGVYEYSGEETLYIKGDVNFNLFFSTTINQILEKYEDTIEVTIYKASSLFPTEIKNENVTIKRELLKGEVFKNKIKDVDLTVTDVDFSIKPGESIVFSIEIIPSDKPAGDFVEYIYDDEEAKDNLEKFSELLKNESSTKIPFIRDIIESTVVKALETIGYEDANISDVEYLLAETIDEILLMADEFNVSSTELIADVCNAIRSSAFVYNSVEHASSVTLPIALEADDENYKVYYLHENNEMAENRPTKESASKTDLKESVTFTGPDFERSKILTTATANVYISHLDVVRLLNLGKSKIVATLVNDDEEISTVEYDEFSRNLIPLPNFLLKPEVITLNFEIPSGVEISYGSHLSLELSVDKNNSNGIFRNLFDKIRRDFNLYYDSTEYESRITLVFEDTDHIQVKTSSDPSNGETVLGGSVVYTVDVTSDYDDVIQIITNGFSDDEQEKWKIDISEEEFTISSGETETIEITITSVSEDLDDYVDEDMIDVGFMVSGKTGRDEFNAHAEISVDAVEYDVRFVNVPPSMNIRHGENDTYKFTIENNNTGLYPDNYDVEATSEHDFTVEVNYDKYGYDIAYGEKAEIQVTVSIPRYTDITSDELIVKVISESGEEFKINVTTKIGSPNFLEKIYQFFEEAANGMGLNDVFGDFAPHFLMVLLLLIIFFFIIIIVLIIKKKFVQLICLDRIKEIKPDEVAQYEIKIKNPTSYVQNYEVKAEQVEPSEGWEISLDRDSLLVEPKSEQTILLTVSPTDFAKSEDWTEVKVVATLPEKQKSDEISTVTTLTGGKPDLKIIGVFHWPTKFKSGEVVKTSFKLENNGDVSADDVTVVLFVNGEQKNKVEGITIPRGGYADIEIPWVAVKGKNNVHIEVV